MRIGYPIDTYHPARGRDGIADSMDAMVEEGLLAERAGFHSVVVPDRHRAAECRYPGPEQLLTRSSAR
jgi:alkanesulfonate monooxygenase SsuD/methylene tetrahydromethanopterin reductase-like flavin-dependent oxidoreductase (luciferase family)